MENLFMETQASQIIEQQDPQSEYVLGLIVEAHSVFTHDSSWVEQIQPLSLEVIKFLRHLLSQNAKTPPEEKILTRAFSVIREKNSNQSEGQFNYHYICFQQKYASELMFRELFLNRLIQTYQDPKIPKTAHFLQMVKSNQLVLKQAMPREVFLTGLNSFPPLAEHISFFLNQFTIPEWNHQVRSRGLQEQFNQCFTTLDNLLNFLSELTAQRRLEFLQNYWFRKKLIRLMNPYTVQINDYGRVYRNVGQFFNVIRHDPLDLIFNIDDISELFRELKSAAGIMITVDELSDDNKLFFLNMKIISDHFKGTIENDTHLSFILLQIKKEARLSWVAEHSHLLHIFKQAVAKTITGEQNMFTVDPVFKLDPNLYNAMNHFTAKGASLKVMKIILQAMDETYGLPIEDNPFAEDKMRNGQDGHEQVLYRELLVEIDKLTRQPLRNDFERSLDHIETKNRITYIVQDEKRLTTLIEHIKDFPWIFLSLDPVIELTPINDLQILYEAMRKSYLPVAPQSHSRFQYLRSKIAPPTRPTIDYSYDIYHGEDKRFYRKLKITISIHLKHNTVTPLLFP